METHAPHVPIMAPSNVRHKGWSRRGAYDLARSLRIHEQHWQGVVCA